LQPELTLAGFSIHYLEYLEAEMGNEKWEVGNYSSKCNYTVLY